jgi:hypothetical protein
VILFVFLSQITGYVIKKPGSNTFTSEEDADDAVVLAALDSFLYDVDSRDFDRKTIDERNVTTPMGINIIMHRLMFEWAISTYHFISY